MSTFAVVIQTRQISTYTGIEAETKIEACKIAKETSAEPTITSDVAKAVIASYKEN